VLPFLVATAADAQQDSEITWDWTRSQRFYLESQVRLPLLVWLATPYNRQARATAFEIRLVTTCGPGEPVGRSSFEVLCTLDEVGLLASGLTQEEGLLDPIVRELDEILTEASVQLVVRPNGRILNIDLEDVERRNARVGAINENLRLVVSRAFAGLDLLLPESARSGPWPQYGALLMRAPSADGSAGMSEIVHAIVASDVGGITVVSGGRGLVSPGEGSNQYDTRMEGRAVFDPRSGRLLDRSWTVVGGPTPSSSIAFGAAGYPYVQQGRVVALTGDETWDVGESMELPPGEAAQTALQQQWQLGADPNSTR
jgi:hypothetical protein